MPELADLKAGDEVAIPYGYDGYNILTIKEVTSRGTIILVNGNKYRSDGTPMEKGSKWYRPSKIEPVTDEIRKVIRHRELSSAINALNINDWKKFSLESLEIIYTEIKKAKEVQQ